MLTQAEEDMTKTAIDAEMPRKQTCLGVYLYMSVILAGFLERLASAASLSAFKRLLHSDITREHSSPDRMVVSRVFA